MNLNNVITGSPVTSWELRAARDRRVLKKWELLKYCRGSQDVSFRPGGIPGGSTGTV